MFKNFNEMVASVKAKRRGTVIIAAAQTNQFYKQRLWLKKKIWQTAYW